MADLQQKDLKDIIAFSGLALECNSSAELEKEVLGKIQHSVNASSSVYCEMAPLPGGWHFTHPMSNDAPTEKPEEWCNHYHTCDPFVSRILKQLHREPGKQILSNYVIRHREYVESEFYHDFMAPQSIYHVMITSLVKDNRPMGLLGLHRPVVSGEFAETDKIKIKILAQYLSAAIQKIQLSETTAERDRIIEVLASYDRNRGIIILNQELMPIFFNEHVRNLFHFPPNNAQEPAGAIFKLPPEIYKRCSVIKKIYSSQSNIPVDEVVEIINNDGTEKTSCNIRLWESETNGLCFLIFVGSKSQGVIRKMALEKFSLSKREIDITHLVGAGMTNAEIAENLYISVRTVENHLRSIYSKVGVHNRTSLVSRLSESSSSHTYIPV